MPALPTATRCALLLVLWTSAVLVSPALRAAELKLAPVGGVYGMFVRPWPVVVAQTPEEKQQVLADAVHLRLTATRDAGDMGVVTFEVSSTDLFGQTEKWTCTGQFGKPLEAAAAATPVSTDLQFTLGHGYHLLRATAKFGDQTLTAVTAIGIVPPTATGLRPDSFFASNTSGVLTGERAKLLALLGIKVQRAHFQPAVNTPDRDWAKKPSTGAALPLDFTQQDKDFAAARELGLWVLPICGYAFQGSGGVGTSELAAQVGMYGPPRDYTEFCATYEQILRHYPEITTVEIWNEPWIFGWTWAAPPAEWQKFQQQFSEMALKVNPKLRLITGNSSMFLEDNIEPAPAAWKGTLSGGTHHPYGYGTGQANWRAGDQFRSMDYGMLVCRRMGLPYYYLTEGGTEYRTPPSPALAAAQTALNACNAQVTKDFPTDAAKATPAYAALLAQQKELAELRARMKVAGADAAAKLQPEYLALVAQEKTLAPVEAQLKAITKDEDKYTPAYLAARAQQLAAAAAVRAIQATLPSNADNLGNATKIVQYAVRQALTGGFQGNAQWNIGYGEEWTSANTAIATMTSLLEDRPVVADIWPANELLTGAIFANARHVTDEVRHLPRASELSVRWPVPVPAERADDPTKVAVLWSLSGPSEFVLDQGGKLTIDTAGTDLRAYDLSGRAIPAVKDQLVLPLGPAPVYVLSDKLSVVELHRRLATAHISLPTPLNLYAFSLPRPAGEKQVLGVRLENQLNRPIHGTLILAINGVAAPTTAPFSLAAAQLLEVAVPWPGVAEVPANQYAITLTAAASTEQETLAPVTRQQLIQVARFVRRTITVDGKLDDWQGVSPVLLDSDMLKLGFDPTDYFLNPNRPRPAADASHPHVTAQLYTAYDQERVYLAVAVHEPTYSSPAGAPVVKGRGGATVTLPYRNAMPGGLNFPANIGADSLQVAFGFRDRVPGYGRPLDDPWAWKGHFYDTDHLFHLYRSTDGDLLIRQWGPQTSRRNGYQCEPVPGLEAVPAGRVKITRDEAAQLTIYECAIPRQEIAGFDPAATRCRFSFLLTSDDATGELNWSEAAGVFDYWRNLGSFAPTWMQRYPCQTYFGISP